MGRGWEFVLAEACAHRIRFHSRSKSGIMCIISTLFFSAAILAQVWRFATMLSPFHVAVYWISGQTLILTALRERSNRRVYNPRQFQQAHGFLPPEHLSVGELKEDISQRCRIPRACQLLTLGNHILEDDESLVQFGNGDETICVSLVITLQACFTGMESEDEIERDRALDSLGKAAGALNTKPDAQEQVIFQLRQFLNDDPDSAAMCAFVAWSNLDHAETMYICEYVRAPAIGHIERLIVIAKLLQVLPTDHDCAIELFHHIIHIASLHHMDEEDVMFINNTMDGLSGAVLCDNVLALTAARQHLANDILPIQCWAMRLFAKLAKDNDPLIEENICQILRYEGTKRFMLKALARLAGRPSDLVKEYMQYTSRDDQWRQTSYDRWLPDSDRDSDFMETDRSGRTMIIAPAALSLRAWEGESGIIVSSVLPLLKDEDWKVRTLAVEALAQLTQTDCEHLCTSNSFALH